MCTPYETGNIYKKKVIFVLGQKIVNVMKYYNLKQHYKYKQSNYIGFKEQIRKDIMKDMKKKLT